MKAITTIFYAFCLWAAASAASSIQVEKLKLAVYNASLPALLDINADVYTDVLFYGCYPALGQKSALYLRNYDGSYKMIRDFVENMPNGAIYCADTPGDVAVYRAGSNGKLFFNSRISTIADNSFTVFFTLDNDDKPTNVKVMPYIEFVYSGSIGENAMFGTLSDKNNRRLMGAVEFADGQWSYRFLNGTLPTTMSTGSCDTQTITQRLSADNLNMTLVHCLQPDFTWALVAQVPLTEWVDYESLLSSRRTFNKNDITTYASLSSVESTGGTTYFAQLDGTKVASFDLWDFGVDPVYFTSISNAWAAPIWINKDILLFSLSLPAMFEEGGDQVAGSIGVVSRDENGKWKVGGRLDLDGAVPAVLKFLKITKSDIIVVAFDGTNSPSGVTPTNYLYSYPLCFQNPLPVTCKQNIQLSSCDPKNPPVLNSLYVYKDDGCGKPVASIASISFNDVARSAVLRFERLGVKVSQCTATFICPRSNTPSKISIPVSLSPNASPDSSPESSLSYGKTIQVNMAALMVIIFVILCKNM